MPLFVIILLQQPFPVKGQNIFQLQLAFNAWVWLLAQLYKLACRHSNAPNQAWTVIFRLICLLLLGKPLIYSLQICRTFLCLVIKRFLFLSYAVLKFQLDKYRHRYYKCISFITMFVYGIRRLQKRTWLLIR